MVLAVIAVLMLAVMVVAMAVMRDRRSRPPAPIRLCHLPKGLSLMDRPAVALVSS